MVLGDEVPPESGHRPCQSKVAHERREELTRFPAGV
jgi:hypothetical protein